VALDVDYSITARVVIDVLERLVNERGAPEFVRSDNGPEFIAQANKDWIAGKGIKTLYIEPGSPWENAYSESFNSRLRDEFLNVELFGSKLEAKVLGREHRDKYNHHRPHSSLGDLPPAEFAARCLAPLRPTAYAPQDSETNPKKEQILPMEFGMLHGSSSLSLSARSNASA
jgi:transposase InsO family protein